jgi:hypothetical protein
MPTWTKDDLRAFENRRAASNPKPEQVVCDGTVATSQGEGCNATRIAVRIVAFRCRLLDPDNLCPKYIIDGLRYAGLLPDDRPQDIALEVAQEKANSASEERIEITMIPDKEDE